MSHSKIYSIFLEGIEARLLTVESAILTTAKADIKGFLQNSQLRILSALEQTGFDIRNEDTTVLSYTPSDQNVSGAVYDLPTAISLLVCNGLVQSTPQTDLDHSLFLGELSLSGEVLPITGALQAVLLAEELNFKNVYLPQQNVEEAMVGVDKVRVFGVNHLNQLTNHLSQGVILTEADAVHTHSKVDYGVDFSDVIGQDEAKRALLVGVAGGHNVLMNGSAGLGKSMLAKRVPTIIPNLSYKEQVLVRKIYAVSPTPYPNARPFRSPHTSSSVEAIVGGGNPLQAGEVTLATKGILFLDELLEFDNKVIEGLRQPLEDREITLSRASKRVTLPADFQLIAATNPCPCANYGSQKLDCTCTGKEITDYQKKLSSPMADRFDIFVVLEAIDRNVKHIPTSSYLLRKKVTEARKIAIKRQGELNSRAAIGTIKPFLALDKESEELLNEAIEEMQLSSRATERILRVARTIADIEKTKNIQIPHLAEAITYKIPIFDKNK